MLHRLDNSKRSFYKLIVMQQALTFHYTSTTYLTATPPYAVDVTKKDATLRPNVFLLIISTRIHTNASYVYTTKRQFRSSAQDPVTKVNFCSRMETITRQVVSSLISLHVNERQQQGEGVSALSFSHSWSCCYRRAGDGK